MRNKNPLMNLRAVPVLSAILLVLMGVPIVQGQTPSRSADFFIVEDPRVFTIFNKYQQAITLQESRLFERFVPLEIVNRDGFLSDNFTRGMTVKIGTAVFYLLKDESGALLNIDQAGYQAIFRNCEILSDTVRVLEGKTINLSSRIDNRGIDSPLVAGDRIRRLFRKGGYEYAQSMGQTSAYGWARFLPAEQGKTWEIVKRKPGRVATTIPDDIRDRIHGQMREINLVLEDLFGRLNQESGQPRPVPEWQVEDTDSHITCVINDPEYATRFSESIQYIINDLENLVRDAGFGVYYNDGVITIRRK